jgi:hypothetical protein
MMRGIDEADLRTRAACHSLGFAVAGCGSVKKTNSGQYTVTLRREVPSGPITVTGSATTAILNVKTDTHIRCKGWMGRDMRVPVRGTAIAS